MINAQTLVDMVENDGMTLKNHKAIQYKSGYQVATEGIETTDVEVALKAIDEYKGNCGIWKSNNIYYIDKSMRVGTKNVALALAKSCNQLSILNWKDMSLIWC